MSYLVVIITHDGHLIESILVQIVLIVCLVDKVP